MVAVEPLGMAEPVRVTRITDEEWANLPEDEEGELVDGVLVEEEMAGWTHETAVLWLATALRLWAVPRRGLVGGSEIKYLLRPGRGRKPDLSLVLPGQKRPPAQGVMRWPADVLVEVVSPSPRDVRRDRLEKLRDYAIFGAKYYWILDPTIRMFEIFELDAQHRYTNVLGESEGKLENIPGCEGLVLDLDALWTELDGIEASDAPEASEASPNDDPAKP